MNKVTLVVALAIAAASSATAQNRQSDAEELRSQALKDEIAWDIVEGLTTEVGPRPAGTEAEARARDWAVAKLKSLGFRNVHVEEYRMPVWVRGEESAEILAPFPQKMRVTALGNSGSTGPAGLRAEIVKFATLDALRAVPDGSLAGKIVYLTHAMRPTQDGSGYGYFGPVRFEGPAVAATKGAAAIVIKSVGTDSHRNPHTGMTRFPAGIAPIPAGALSIPDAENLERMLARKKPVTMQLLLTPRTMAEQVSGNVVAEVPGSDPDSGIILIGGHLDSWDPGTGAVDNASGVAITAAAAKRIMDMGRRPKRTIRVVWWGAEEVGGIGGTNYFERHKDENIVLVAESDFGADRVWRLQTKLAGANKALGDQIASVLAPLGISRGEEEASGGADASRWVANGLAVIDLNQDGTRYFDLHHTPDDTLDKIDLKQLQQNVAAWTAMLAVAANHPEPIARPAS